MRQWNGPDEIRKGVLEFLREHGSATHLEIQQALDLMSHQASLALGELCAKGLVSRPTVKGQEMVGWAAVEQPATQVDHVAILVQAGKMIRATEFLNTVFGWPDIPERQVQFDGGSARFFLAGGSGSLVQVTELDHYRTNGALPGVHLGVAVPDVGKAVVAIREWAASRGVKVEFEPVPGFKTFVSIGDVFATEFELVPA